MISDGGHKSVNFLTANVIEYLESKIGPIQIKNEVKSPAEKPVILMWEQKNCVLLPDDLKHFYSVYNGFNLAWSLKVENTTIKTGSMVINPVAQLQSLHQGAPVGGHIQAALWDLVDNSYGADTPSFAKSNNKIFELDSCNGFGKVCLVYRQNKQENTEIWFLDRSLRWHFISKTFIEYFRLMLIHLGLPYWQYAFTDVGLPHHSKQWFNLYAPIRLELEALSVDGEHEVNEDRASSVVSSPLELTKIFKGKNDKKSLN